MDYTHCRAILKRYDVYSAVFADSNEVESMFVKVAALLLIFAFPGAIASALLTAEEEFANCPRIECVILHFSSLCLRPWMLSNQFSKALSRLRYLRHPSSVRRWNMEDSVRLWMELRRSQGGVQPAGTNWWLL